LLKNLYMVYDFENSEIKLGVNSEAEDSGVLIYNPGERPVIKTKQELLLEEIKESEIAT